MNSKTRTRGTGKAPHILYFSGSTSVREEPVRTRKNPKRVSYCVHTLLRTNILRTQPSHLRSRLITVAYEGEVSQSALEPKFWHALRAIGRAARRAPPALCLESAQEAHAEPIASLASLCLAQVAAWSSRRRQQIERGILWAAAKTSRKNRSEKGKNAYNASLSPSPRKIKEVTEDFQTSLLSKNSKTQDFQPSLLSKTSQVHSKNYLPSLSL